MQLRESSGSEKPAARLFHCEEAALDAAALNLGTQETREEGTWVSLMSAASQSLLPHVGEASGKPELGEAR